jgi:hypothetical protein
MYTNRYHRLCDQSLSDLLTKLRYASEDMLHASHPDEYDEANKLAWEIMNAISNHRESPYGKDSKFRKAPFVDPSTGKCLLDSIREAKKRK